MNPFPIDSTSSAAITLVMPKLLIISMFDQRFLLNSQSIMFVFYKKVFGNDVRNHKGLSKNMNANCRMMYQNQFVEGHEIC
jgi:hypothetical protein